MHRWIRLGRQSDGHFASVFDPASILYYSDQFPIAMEQESGDQLTSFRNNSLETIDFSAAVR